MLSTFYTSISGHCKKKMNPTMFFFAVVAVGATAMAQRATETLHSGHAESVARKGMDIFISR